MKKIGLFFMLGILFVLVSGCASTVQFVQLPDQNKTIEDLEKGRIYVMRPATVGMAIPMLVTEGGKTIGETGPKGYLCWEREPGETQILSQAENTDALNLNVQKGIVYYIFQHVRMGWVKARNELELVNEDEGKNVLKKCSPPTVKASKK
jgi:hypothetical protein